MKKINKRSIMFFGELIKSLIHEKEQAEINGGFVSEKYINEKCDKIKKIIADYDCGGCEHKNMQKDNGVRKDSFGCDLKCSCDSGGLASCLKHGFL